MKITDTIAKVLLRKTPLRPDDWIELIEDRRQMLSPHLDSITLPELGKLKCLAREGFQHDLYLDGPTVHSASSGLRLKTQGIFRVQPWEAITRYEGTGYQPGKSSGHPTINNGLMHIWGLTRSNEWVLVSVQFLGEDGHKGRGYERAHQIDIYTASLAYLLDKTKEKPEEIWRALGTMAMEIAERQAQAYRAVQELALNVSLETRLIDRIG